MSESDPSVAPQPTAGDVGARRHNVGEAVRPDESNSLNVPSTTAPPPEFTPRPTVEETPRATATPGDRHTAEPERHPRPTATVEQPAPKRSHTVPWVAVGAVAALVLRRVLRRHGRTLGR